VPVSIPPGLAHHGLFSTGDPTTAERLGAPLLGRHRLRPVAAASPFGASLHAVVTGPVTLGYLQVVSAVEVELAGSAPRFLMVTPSAGPSPVRCGTRSFAASPDVAVIVQPGQPVTVGCPDRATLLVVALERQAVLAHLSRLLGRSLDRPLAFDPEVDLAAGRASRWNLAVELLHLELFEHGSLLRTGVGQRQVEEFLMSSLLYGQGSTYREALCEPHRRAEHPAVASAREFIEANLADRLTAADVAAAVGVSPRTLQSAFRSDLRTTVTAYIRGRRLERTRADLCVVGPAAGATVTDVATRWGITHLGRYAAAYRDRFGESPSSTLRRASRPGG
jgi:AraC-like DNA-binding protein